jgi:hypothetical protein
LNGARWRFAGAIDGALHDARGFRRFDELADGGEPFALAAA